MCSTYSPKVTALLQSLLDKDFRKRPFIHQVVRAHFPGCLGKPLDQANLRVLEEHQHQRRSAVSTCVTELQELASDEEDIIEALADSCQSESEGDDDTSTHQTSHTSFRISSPKKQ